MAKRNNRDRLFSDMKIKVKGIKGLTYIGHYPTVLSFNQAVGRNSFKNCKTGDYLTVKDKVIVYHDCHFKPLDEFENDIEETNKRMIDDILTKMGKYRSTTSPDIKYILDLYNEVRHPGRSLYPN